MVFTTSGSEEVYNSECACVCACACVCVYSSPYISKHLQPYFITLHRINLINSGHLALISLSLITSTDPWWIHLRVSMLSILMVVLVSSKIKVPVPYLAESSVCVRAVYLSMCICCVCVCVCVSVIV